MPGDPDFIPAEATPDFIPAGPPNAGLAGPAGAPPPKGTLPEMPWTSKSNPKLNIAESGRDMPEYVGATGAAGAGLMGLSVAAPALAPAGRVIASAARRHPIIAQTIGSAAIGEARHLPVVGKLIPPYSEMLPFLLGGGKGEEPATAEPTPNPGAPLPERLPEDVWRARGVGRGATTQEPSAGLGRIPVRNAQPGPIESEPITNPPRSEWPPPEPKGAFDKPVASPRGISDLRDDEAVREGIREKIGQADRKVFASQRERNDVSVPKGVLTGEINKPAKLTSGKSNGSRGVGVTTPETDDLTPILKKSLAAARKGKKGD